jgi:hypothetical protein
MFGKAKYSETRAKVLLEYKAVIQEPNYDRPPNFE